MIVSCAVALLMGAMPLTAQNAAQGSQIKTHAELGTLTAVHETERSVVTTYPAESDEMIRRTYTTTETTLVEGLGGIMAVGEIPQDAIGRVVIVEFVTEGGEAIAERLRFPTARTVQVTRGTITGIDRADRQLMVRNHENMRELELGIGYGALIDSPEGLLSLSDLRAGHEVVVYYAEPETAYLIVRPGMESDA